MGYLIADNGDLDMVFPVIEGEVLRCAVGTGTRTISAPRKEFA